ncbi:MAG: exo-alpha-sialidase [Prevotella sp.]|nr:exo-alpha-sialidase [Prevotella sp.]
MKTRLMTLVFALQIVCPFVSNAQQTTQRLFETVEGKIPYRIPAIATTKNGTLIAVADYRYCYSDIGFGPVDLHYRLSHDNGLTWGEERVLADGTGDETDVQNPQTAWRYAFGDCAIVADRESQEVAVLCVGGKTVYHRARRQNPNRVVLFRSHDGGETWDKGREITEEIYGLFDQRREGPINSLFVGSGKIHQSRYVKVGNFYRLYVALCTLSGNFVIYSDDFGDTWRVLGDPNHSPARDGDEPKCEELPDGSVILSSRYQGRLFNIFTFTDAAKGEGTWDLRAKVLDMKNVQNACNGEIILLPVTRKKDSKKVWIALQSIPFGPNRTNVGFYYHELLADHEGAALFAYNWKKGLQVSTQSSAYSTFTLQKDGKLGFLWEEGPTGYNIDYRPLSIEEITLNEYR